MCKQEQDRGNDIKQARKPPRVDAAEGEGARSEKV